MVGRHVYCGLFKGITLFSSNACVAAFCELASVGIGHSKNVIGLNSLIRTTVAWDWFAEQVTLRFLFDAKEDITGFFEGLALWLSQIDAGWSIVIESGCVLCEMLLIDDWVILIIVASVEFPDGHWVDWLLVRVLPTDDSDGCCNGVMLCLCMVLKLLFHACSELNV